MFYKKLPRKTESYAGYIFLVLEVHVDAINKYEIATMFSVITPRKINFEKKKNFRDVI